MKIRLAGEIQPDSIVDGEGIRAVIWMQGCSHNCKGCHNPMTHDFNGGYISDTDDIKRQITELKLLDGITLSGGDPMFQIEASLDLAKFCHRVGLNVWCYTGYTFEELLKISEINPNMLDLLKELDVVVDGKFILELKTANAKFRGSSNQRIIDVQKSLENKKAVCIKKYDIKKSNIVIESKRDEALFI